MLGYVCASPPCHLFEGDLCCQHSPEGRSSNSCLSPCHRRGFPACAKGAMKKQQCLLKSCEWQLSSPLSPHTHASTLLLFLPQTRHPATGLGEWEGSQQPSCGLCSARCGGLLGSFQTTKKNPKYTNISTYIYRHIYINTLRKTKRPHIRGCAGSGPGLPAPPSPAPGEQPGCPLPAPQALPAKGGEKPKRSLSGDGGYRIKSGRAPPHLKK